MLISQKPEYVRKIEEDRLSPFANDEVELNLADKLLSNIDTYTAHTYYNYAIVLNSHIERSLACESPRMQPAVQRLCELSSLVSKASDIRVSSEEQNALSAFTKALLARRAADLILVHQATSSFSNKSSDEWKVCVSALCRIALYWLPACKPSIAATSALVALEALEANSIRKYLNIDDERVEKMLRNEECAEIMADFCGSACPSACTSPSRSGYSLAPTHISFVPLEGFRRSIGEVVEEKERILSEEKYRMCIGVLANILEDAMVLRRLVNIMRVDGTIANASFIDDLFPSLPSHPDAVSFKRLINPDVTRFDLKCFLLFLTGWTRLALSSPLSPLSGRLLSPAPLPASVLSAHQISLWKGLVLRGQKRFVGLTQHALSIQQVKKVTRLISSPPIPLMGTVFYTIVEDKSAGEVTELYARKIVDSICCADSSADRTVFRSPPGGIDFDADDETRLLEDASIFISSRERERGEWTLAERTLLMCEQKEEILGGLVEVYTAWLNSPEGEDIKEELERKLAEVKTKLIRESPRSNKENEDGWAKGDGSAVKSRSPAISIEGDDLNRSSYSEYASAPSTPFKGGTIFGAETPTFHTPGGRPSLWPGALARKNLFMKATGTPTRSPLSSRSSAPPVEIREEEVQTEEIEEEEHEESVFNAEPSASLGSVSHNTTTMSSRHRRDSGAIPEDTFQLESLMKGLELINEEFVKNTKKQCDRLDAQREEERKADERRREMEEKEREEAKEEIRRFEEKIKEKRKTMALLNSPKTPTRKPLAPTASVDAMQQLQQTPTSSLGTLFPQQRVTMQQMQQPNFAATPATSMLQQLLGPSSVQSPALHRMLQPDAQQAGLIWSQTGLAAGGVPRPLFPAAQPLQQQPVQQAQQELQQPKPVVQQAPAPTMQQPAASAEQTKKETLSATPSKPLSAFESAFLKKKEEEKGGQHKGCICCEDDDVMDKWFAAYEKVVERNDTIN